MKENYVKLINACLPDALIKALVEKTGLDQKNVENVCLEVAARVFGDGNDLSKEGILKRLKVVVSGDELKNILSRLETKYSISTLDSGAVLNQLLPLLFKRLTTLEDSYFESTKQEVEPSVDDVFKNIEMKAEAQYAPKIEVKEEKKVEPIKKDEVQGTVDSKELSLIEKICIIAVGVALLALVGTVVFLFIKQGI